MARSSSLAHARCFVGALELGKLACEPQRAALRGLESRVRFVPTMCDMFSHLSMRAPKSCATFCDSQTGPRSTGTRAHRATGVEYKGTRDRVGCVPHAHDSPPRHPPFRWFVCVACVACVSGEWVGTRENCGVNLGPSTSARVS
jgi:hypothetical protein